MALALLDKPEAGIWRISLNQPERRNPIGQAVREAVTPLWLEALAEDGCRAIVLTGAGGTFCAGGDIATMGRTEPAAARKRMKKGHHFTRLLYESEKPVVAAVEGHAVGAGAGLALLCDTVVMGQGAKFGIPFFKLGLVPDFGLLYTLPRRIGSGPAKQLLLHGRMIGADEALALGVVDRVVPDDQVQAAALEEARSLAQHPPFAMAVAKRLIDTMPGSLDQALEMEANAQAMCFAGPDVEEGVAAFKEKRKPRFK